MTEAAHQIASNPLSRKPRKIGSVGLPTGPDVAILDSAGASLPPGVLGEISFAVTASLSATKMIRRQTRRHSRTDGFVPATKVTATMTGISSSSADSRR